MAIPETWQGLMTVHIYLAESQPATKWRDALGGWHKMKKRHLGFCWNCKRRRWAQNLIIQAYYDVVYGFCVEGKGCKAKVR